jgi:hypothetical protein
VKHLRIPGSRRDTVTLRAGDWVLSHVFDHTSVLQLIEEKWNLPALTQRDAAATSPLGVLNLTAPPAFLTPSRLPAPALACGTW